MDITDCDHDKVLIPFESGPGGQAIEEFEDYLNEDGKRINEEHNRELRQHNKYDEIDILNPEFMDNSEMASYQWCRDNPGWWKDILQPT